MQRDAIFSSVLGSSKERRETILHSLAKRNLLTDDLEEKLLAADTLARVEDICLLFRPKRKTRATIAKERGLEPLDKRFFAQDIGRDLDLSVFHDGYKERIEAMVQSR